MPNHTLLKYFLLLINVYRKNIPLENLCQPITVSSKSIPNSTSPCPSRYSLDGYKTPPRIVPVIPLPLPQVTQGRKFIDESESESDDNNDSLRIINKSDNLDVSGINNLDYVVSVQKTSHVESFCLNNSKKRDLNSQNRDGDDEPLEKQPKLKSDANDHEFKLESDKNSNKYSELKYLQCFGKINHIRQPQKHRGIVSTNNNTTENTIDETATTSSQSSSTLSSSFTATTSNGWDRDACLKISYRIRQSDSFIQFALIVYEPSNKNPRSQRNLLKEFEKSSFRKRVFSAAKNESNTNQQQISSTSSTKKSLRF